MIKRKEENTFGTLYLGSIVSNLLQGKELPTGNELEIICKDAPVPDLSKKKGRGKLLKRAGGDIVAAREPPGKKQKLRDDPRLPLNQHAVDSVIRLSEVLQASKQVVQPASVRDPAAVLEPAILELVKLVGACFQTVVSCAPEEIQLALALLKLARTVWLTYCLEQSHHCQQMKHEDAIRVIAEIFKKANALAFVESSLKNVLIYAANNYLHVELVYILQLSIGTMTSAVGEMDVTEIAESLIAAKVPVESLRHFTVPIMESILQPPALTNIVFAWPSLLDKALPSAISTRVKILTCLLSLPLFTSVEPRTPAIQSLMARGQLLCHASRSCSNAIAALEASIQRSMSGELGGFQSENGRRPSGRTRQSIPATTRTTLAPISAPLPSLVSTASVSSINAATAAAAMTVTAKVAGPKPSIENAAPSSSGGQRSQTTAASTIAPITPSAAKAAASTQEPPLPPPAPAPKEQPPMALEEIEIQEMVIDMDTAVHVNDVIEQPAPAVATQPVQASPPPRKAGRPRSKPKPAPKPVVVVEEAALELDDESEAFLLALRTCIGERHPVPVEAVQSAVRTFLLSVLRGELTDPAEIRQRCAKVNAMLPPCEFALRGRVYGIIPPLQERAFMRREEIRSMQARVSQQHDEEVTEEMEDNAVVVDLTTEDEAALASNDDPGSSSMIEEEGEIVEGMQNHPPSDANPSITDATQEEQKQQLFAVLTPPVVQAFSSTTFTIFAALSVVQQVPPEYHTRLPAHSVRIQAQQYWTAYQELHHPDPAPSINHVSPFIAYDFGKLLIRVVKLVQVSDQRPYNNAPAVSMDKNERWYFVRDMLPVARSFFKLLGSFFEKNRIAEAATLLGFWKKVLLALLEPPAVVVARVRQISQRFQVSQAQLAPTFPIITQLAQAFVSEVVKQSASIARTLYSDPQTPIVLPPSATVEDIARDAGYSEESIERVKQAIRNQRLRFDVCGEAARAEEWMKVAVEIGRTFQPNEPEVIVRQQLLRAAQPGVLSLQDALQKISLLSVSSTSSPGDPTQFIVMSRESLMTNLPVLKLILNTNFRPLPPHFQQLITAVVMAIFEARPVTYPRIQLLCRRYGVVRDRLKAGIEMLQAALRGADTTMQCRALLASLQPAQPAPQATPVQQITPAQLAAIAPTLHMHIASGVLPKQTTGLLPLLTTGSSQSARGTAQHLHPLFPAPTLVTRGLNGYVLSPPILMDGNDESIPAPIPVGRHSSPSVSNPTHVDASASNHAPPDRAAEINNAGGGTIPSKAPTNGNGQTARQVPSDEEQRQPDAPIVVVAEETTTDAHAPENTSATAPSNGINEPITSTINQDQSPTISPERMRSPSARPTIAASSLSVAVTSPQLASTRSPISEAGSTSEAERASAVPVAVQREPPAQPNEINHVQSTIRSPERMHSPSTRPSTTMPSPSVVVASPQSGTTRISTSETETAGTVLAVVPEESRAAPSPPAPAPAPAPSAQAPSPSPSPAPAIIPPSPTAFRTNTTAPAPVTTATLRLQENGVITKAELAVTKTLDSLLAALEKRRGVPRGTMSIRLRDQVLDRQRTRVGDLTFGPEDLFIVIGSPYRVR